MSKQNIEADLLYEITILRERLDAARRDASGGVTMMDAANAAEIGILTNVPTLTTMHNLRAHTGRIRACTWAAQDANLISIGADNYICLWDVRSGLIRNLIDITMNQATAADSTPDLAVIFAGGLYANVEAFAHQPRPPEDGYSEYVSSAVFEHSGRINCITFLEDQRLLTAACVDGVLLWDVNSVRIVKKLAHSTDVSAVISFSADSQVLITGAADGVPRIWDLRKQKPLISSMFGHESEITCIEKHVGSHTFITGSDDAVVNLYDDRLDFPLACYNKGDVRVPNGDDGADRIGNHSGAEDDHDDGGKDGDSATTAITGIAASTSGRIIISGSRNGCVCVWDVFDVMSPVAIRRESGPVMALKMAKTKIGLAVVTWGTTTELKIVSPA